MVFKTDYRLIQVKSIAECSKGSILQYFRPSLSYQFVLSIFERPFYAGFTVQIMICCSGGNVPMYILAVYIEPLVL